MEPEQEPNLNPNLNPTPKRLAGDAFAVEEAMARDQRQHWQQHAWHDFEISPKAWHIEFVTRDDPQHQCVLYAHIKTGRPLLVLCDAVKRRYKLYFYLPYELLGCNKVNEANVSRLTERCQELDAGYNEMGPSPRDPLLVERELLALVGFGIQEPVVPERRTAKGTRRLRTEGQAEADPEEEMIEEIQEEVPEEV